VQACLNERSVFSAVELVAALEDISRLEPLPLLTMRTAIQTLVLWPKSIESILSVLRHLLQRQVVLPPRYSSSAGIRHSVSLSVERKKSALIGNENRVRENELKTRL